LDQKIIRNLKKISLSSKQNEFKAEYLSTFPIFKRLTKPNQLLVLLNSGELKLEDLNKDEIL
jgi:hypothetical protein